MKFDNKDIKCPFCDEGKGLKIRISSGAEIVLPIENGQACFPKELIKNTLLVSHKEDQNDNLIASTGPFIQFNDPDSEFKVTIFKDEAEVMISCKKCNKYFDLDSLPMNPEELECENS